MSLIEKKFDRREVIKVLGALALSACAPAAPTSEATTPTPIVIGGQVKTLEPSPIPTRTPEQKPPEGWTRFRSLSFPYEIDYPSEWAPGTTYNTTGKKVDVFKGDIAKDLPTNVSGLQTNVTVFAEPIESWVRFDDYRRSIENQLNELITRARGGAGGQLVGGGFTRIADQEAVVLNARIYQGIYSPQLEQRVGVFTANRRGWQITLSCATSVIGIEEPKFNQMLSSFRLIR